MVCFCILFRQLGLITCFGCMLGSLGVFSMILMPTRASCMAQFWLVVLCFDFTFLPLVLRSYRVYVLLAFLLLVVLFVVLVC